SICRSALGGYCADSSLVARRVTFRFAEYIFPSLPRRFSGVPFGTPERARLTVITPIPLSSAIARSDFPGLRAMALAAYAEAEMYPASQSQPASPCAPHSEQKM